ncbi:Ig-like domain-containing protein [Mycobacterium sp. TJFP1]|uniref:Ig-like domain-containing protein n=1 Tax=Mycolicibacterium sp. D5.8-2 TaxID=3085903 RepID=UPI00298D0A21|nr:Ig-like domain-containing protein [Mycolicibacterium sp. D5.8-2]MDW5612653.1 Ig-like domain-containing protein [Mycolicibacterium sp. D5.8-2]
MSLTRGGRPAGSSRPFRPTLRWAQVGVAGTGMAFALLAAPAVATADTGADEGGADSSATTDAASTPSPRADSLSRHTAAGDSTGESDARSAEDEAERVLGTLHPETSERAVSPPGPRTEHEALSDDPEPAVEPDPPEAGPALDTPSRDTAPTPGKPESTHDPQDGDAETAADGARATSATSTPSARMTLRGPTAPGASTAPLSDTAQMANEAGSPMLSPDPQDESVTEPGGVEALPLGALRAAASSTSYPAYPAPVDAPVTWRSIVSDALSWIGLGMATDQHIPDGPINDLLAGLWVGMRRLHYTFFNSSPELDHGAATEDPDTGIITGDLEAHDADGDVITFVLTGAPTHGTVSFAEDGRYTYIPDTAFAATGGTDTFTVTATDTGGANPWHTNLPRLLWSALRPLLSALGFTAPVDSSSTTTVTVTVTPQACRTDGAGAECAAARAPKITLHNNSEHTIWVYNLPSSGDYSIGADFTPVSIAKGASAPVTLAVGTGSPGSPQNRIYIVEGETGFTLPVSSSSGVDAFNPTAPSEGNSFLNYNFVEYYLYPDGGGGYQYTIDTSYIDEWSLPIQYKFTLNGARWSGAVDGHTYGFDDYDTVVNQLNAAGGPYKHLVWGGGTPWAPQPPSTVHRIIGPDKVWTAQASQPASNVNMNHVGWVPTSYQDFVQYDSHTEPDGHVVYPYAQNGTKYSRDGNFSFWKNEVDAPASTPYPIALRTAAVLDGFPAKNGVYGFFTYPNDETAGQFTNIPTSVSLDIYVHGSSDGVSDSVIEGGSWFYTSTTSPSGRGLANRRHVVTGSSATDTFILDSVFTRSRTAPVVVAEAVQGDIVVIDRTALGATSYEVDVVDRAWFLGGGLAKYDSQFVYDRSTGILYYDQDPDRFGYTGVLANLSCSSADAASVVFVL